MESDWKRWAWPLAKLLFAAAILVGVSWQFYSDLTQKDRDGRPLLYDLRWQPGWLALSALLYVAFLSSSCWYWRRLLQHFGKVPPPSVTTRAYFVSQLGKYVPGKAWSLLLRGGLVRDANLRFGLAVLTCFYEVLTTMASGALAAAIAFIIEPPAALDLYMSPVLAGVLLVGLCGVPLLPAVFNRIVGRIAHRLHVENGAPLPKVDLWLLLQGFAATMCGWGLLGLSVWAGFAAVLPERPPLDLAIWLRCLGAIGLAYVGGFLIPFLPAGLGGREVILRRLLGYTGSEAPVAIVVSVLLMRLAWTTADVILAGILYLSPTAKYRQNDHVTE